MNSSGLADFPKFDEYEGQVWKYPDNYPIREYQFKICQECMFNNTLVALPTGLGKTLIAAVVMYNYYIWFPTGKVVFMAPTRPLVNQQMKACHSVVGIPEVHCAHIEGSVSTKSREQLWGEKRVIFCTPQTLMNDLTNGRVDAKQIVCIVIDEAHRATANYAYTTVVTFFGNVWCLQPFNLAFCRFNSSRLCRTNFECWH